VQWARVYDWSDRNRQDAILRRNAPGEKFRVSNVQTFVVSHRAGRPVRLVSGREIEAQIVKIEITVLGTFLHVEFDQEVANVTTRQILGFYDFVP
jgi:hypothetical protein